MDFKVLEAYQMLRDEICPQCGHPVWLCRSKSDDIEWTANTDVCYATRRKEEAEWQQNNKSKHGEKRRRPDRDEKAKWGRYTYVTPRVPSYAPEGTELPTRRDYYEGLMNV